MNNTQSVNSFVTARSHIDDFTIDEPTISEFSRQIMVDRHLHNVGTSPMTPVSANTTASANTSATANTSAPPTSLMNVITGFLGTNPRKSQPPEQTISLNNSPALNSSTSSELTNNIRNLSVSLNNNSSELTNNVRNLSVALNDNKSRYTNITLNSRSNSNIPYITLSDGKKIPMDNKYLEMKYTCDKCAKLRKKTMNNYIGRKGTAFGPENQELCSMISMLPSAVSNTGEVKYATHIEPLIGMLNNPVYKSKETTKRYIQTLKSYAEPTSVLDKFTAAFKPKRDGSKLQADAEEMMRNYDCIQPEKLIGGVRKNKTKKRILHKKTRAVVKTYKHY